MISNNNYETAWVHKHFVSARALQVCAVLAGPKEFLWTRTQIPHYFLIGSEFSALMIADFSQIRIYVCVYYKIY